jgi:hypothetical protein
MVPLYFSAPKTNWGPQIQDDFIYVSPERPLKGYNLRMECYINAFGMAQFLSKGHDNVKCLWDGKILR